VTVRARWHTELAVPDDDELDPFRHRVEQLGMPIRLGDEFAGLSAELAALVALEGRLYNTGIRCQVKDRDDTCCSACPLSAHQDMRDPLGQLCRVGRAQEQLSTRMAAEREASRAQNQAR
jgi:hypothetical protein